MKLGKRKARGHKGRAPKRRCADRDSDDGESQAGDAAGPAAEAAAVGRTDHDTLVADALYVSRDDRWRNKERTLVICRRGVTHRFRHLVEDLRRLMPHHKSEPKFDQKASLHQINQACELNNCNNVLFFECRNAEQDQFLWLARVPTGPTIEFQVLNVHTSGEVRLHGNCLLGSRPILHFDAAFGELPQLRLVRTLLAQALGTPRNHPKSRPYHDHVLCFYYLDHKIWLRHYEIKAEVASAKDDPDRQMLTEIGPRMVLDPIRVMAGSFSGAAIYTNAHYVAPDKLRAQAKLFLKNPTEGKTAAA